MALKLVVFAALMALSCAAALVQDETTTTVSPPTTPVARQTDEDYDSHPQYVYSYTVSDSLTGDHKHQEESRESDVVRGSYSLLQPDGTRRVVHYHADDITGFNAVITNEAVQHAPTVRSKLTLTPTEATERASPVNYHG